MLPVRLLERAQPIRASDVDRQNPQSMTLRIFNERERLVEAHRLVVENRGCECGQVITFEVGAGISNEGKTCRMRFRKTVKRKRTDRQHNVILRLSGDSIFLQALAAVLFQSLSCVLRNV